MVMMSPSGEVIMNTYDRDEPAVFPINQAFDGLGLALMKMKTGDKWRVFLPPNLTFHGKASPDGKVPANAITIYELELLEIAPVVQP
jgi:FKBP-type peptidyl-prolyl cis-trans isomerase FklB